MSLSVAAGAYTAGLIVGRLLPAVGGLIILGVGLMRRHRDRRAGRWPPRGIVTLAVGSVVLGLWLLGTLANALA